MANFEISYQSVNMELWLKGQVAAWRANAAAEGNYSKGTEGEFGDEMGGAEWADDTLWGSEADSRGQCGSQENNGEERNQKEQKPRFPLNDEGRSENG